MKCFQYFSNEERNDEDVVVSRFSSWHRSFSVASSTNVDYTSRRSEFDSDNFFLSSSAESLSSHDHLFTRRPNNNNNNNSILRVFSFAELKSATKGFSRGLVIGEGGFGSVYKALLTLNNHFTIHVAVKQLNRHGFQGHKEWINEVNFLGVVNHPNLVKLVGYCAEDDERGIQRLLVYELMHNRSLENHLLTGLHTPLSWMTRLKIAQDAARGLAYLHEEMDFQLIFRDFKTSNILLDEDFNAKLSDFGLARQGPLEGQSHVSTTVVGTVGYAAPEYVQTGRLTCKSDVWSFGVVLYEVITGRRALERNLPRGEQKLLEWVRPYVSDTKKFHLIVDPRLEGQYCVKSAQRLASLANKCLMKQPKSRPKMSEVVEILGNIISETSVLEEDALHLDNKMDDAKEPIDRKKGFVIREMVNLRNKSIAKLDWRNWSPGLVRTW
ncbi:hypothetical protein ACFE04_013677 [Oxalis oulophora]